MSLVQVPYRYCHARSRSFNSRLYQFLFFELHFCRLLPRQDLRGGFLSLLKLLMQACELQQTWCSSGSLGAAQTNRMHLNLVFCRLVTMVLLQLQLKLKRTHFWQTILKCPNNSFVYHFFLQVCSTLVSFIRTAALEPDYCRLAFL